MAAPPTLTRRVFRPDDTPARIRQKVAAVVIAAAALLTATSLLMARAQDQARIIGDEAAPQAATASDLYFALSDLDAQAARMVLIDDADALAGSQIDALGTYRERSRQVDADLAGLLATADRATALQLATDLSGYREWVWQALTVESQLPTQPPGKLPAAAHGFYTEATNVLHLELLPAAQRLRDASAARLNRAYTQQRITEVLGIGLAVLLGGATLVLLVALQMWLVRRFRRLLNPALLAATAVTLALVVSACVVFALSGQRLNAARHDSLEPYLALSQARAVSYDAAADTSRYLISGGLAFYRDDFTAKSDSLATLAVEPGVRDRWKGYQRDHERIVALADSGRTAAAIDTLTGIRRGDAAFDFSYFDAAISTAATTRKEAFDVSFRDGRRLLTGWVVVPIVAMALVILLVPLGVRRRLAEYR
jgi:hypothetical protein